MLMETMLKRHEEIISTLQKENNNIWVRPETTGKKTQWGTLNEIIELSKNFKQISSSVLLSELNPSLSERGAYILLIVCKNSLFSIDNGLVTQLAL